MKHITQEMLINLLNYNPETGDLSWKPRPLSAFPNKGTCASWNTRCAGKVISCVDNLGYYMTSINNKNYHAHRLAFLIHNGYLPEVVDHKNRNKLDNRACNLRAADKSLNACNSKTRSDNTSGTKGVGLHKSSGKWRARIRVDKKEYYLGLFANKEDASNAVKTARSKLHGDFAFDG